MENRYAFTAFRLGRRLANTSKASAWLTPGAALLLAGALLLSFHLPAAPAASTAEPQAAAPQGCAGMLPDFTQSTPPADYAGTLPASQTDLAVFAWQHFVALSWGASYSPPQNQTRGTPGGGTFFGTGAQPDLTVWQTYRHKNELYRANGAAPDSDYDDPPIYTYNNTTNTNNLPSPCDPKNDTNPSEFINLDENSQLGLCYMFAQPSGSTAPGQVLFLAKLNEANYDYIASNQLYTRANQDTYGSVNKADLATYGAICQQTAPTTCAQDVTSSPSAGYCLPCGGTGSEGTIHVKSAWRALTTAEASQGRYFTAPVVFYRLTSDSTNVCYTNDTGTTWGLIGLHIIHKTEKFPAFFFASWEHVDNIASNLTFENTIYGGPTSTVGKMLPYQRASHNGQTLPSADVQAVNQCVQSTIAANNASSVWQYYQLVGVQGTPVDYSNYQSDLPNYFLANNVIESNAFFQSFVGNEATYSATGTGPEGTTLGVNVNYNGATFDVGGCQGCHGNAQQGGTDMSFLTASGSNTTSAEAIGDFENLLSERVKMYLGHVPKK
ncbi:MAG TPA: hypothetical protein VMT85_13020 [Thermoanaerobaculia bacterium]|nr:hypothetical protein [Thermoanaerobaculia bacterium]